MKKVLILTAVVSMIGASVAMGCGTCGCSAKKEKQTTSCTKDAASCSKEASSCTKKDSTCSKKSEAAAKKSCCSSKKK